MFRSLATLLLATLLPAAVFATTIVPLSRAELAARADQVVRARVLSQRPARSERSGRILTVSRLKVLETYRGTLAGEVELEQLGGTLDGATLTVPGDARLEGGEEVVVFLRCAGKPRCRILGLALGKYAVRLDREGRRIAVREASGLREASGRPLADEALPLAALEQELKAVKR